MTKSSEALLWVRVAASNLVEAEEAVEDKRSLLDSAIWDGHEAGLSVVALGEAAGRSRQAIYDIIERESKRRDIEARYKRIREWVRDYKGMDLPETGTVAASIVQDYDNWIEQQEEAK